MKITIDGWESEGLRCPDVKISLLENGRHKKVSLIQMPNGTGKTTTLKMLRAALTGEAQYWDSESILELKSLKEAAPNQGKFLLRLSVDDKPLIIEITLNFIEGRVRYITSSPMLGGVVEGWSPPSTIKRFLDEKFVSLFIFDGEFASNLLNPLKTKATEAIETLSQLDIFDEISKEADLLWEKERRGVTGTSRTTLNSLRDDEKKLSERKIALEAKEQEIKNQEAILDQKTSEASKLIEKKINENEAISSERTRLIGAKNLAENNLSSCLESFLKEMRQPQRLYPGFTKHIKQLKASLDKTKLPQKSSQQFFVELSESAECICGRIIGPTEKNKILENSENYLSEEFSGVLNALKENIKVYVEDSDQDGLSNSKKKLLSAQSAFYEASTNLNAHEALIRENSDQTFTEMLDEYNFDVAQLTDIRENLSALRRPYRNTDGPDAISIPSITTQLSDIQSRIAEVTNTVDLRERVNVLKKIALRAKELSKSALNQQLLNECNTRLASVLQNSPLEIEDIDNHIKLKGQASGSVGQTLAVAYVFLTVALHRGSHQFPLVVDSPAGSLEQLVRREIGKVIPVLCEQFISFIIDTEKSGFVSALESAAKDSVSYTTIFRVNPTTENLIKDLPSQNLALKDDSAVVTGKDFFVKFTLDKEEANV